MRVSVAAARRGTVLTAAMTVLLLASAVLALGTGRYEIAPGRVLAILFTWGRGAASAAALTEANVVLTIRLPRILMALLSGAGLALAGAALQGLFRNPLVGPQVIGVSSGAAFGGVLAILLGLSRVGLLGIAFALGLVALVLVYALSNLVARGNILALILAGVVVSGFFSALVSLTQYVADAEDTLPTMVFWLLGSFATANWDKCALIAVPVLAGSALLLGLRWRINLLSLGDADARALGVPVAALRWLILVLVACIVAAQVAVSGIMGWVGLVVPHMARMMVGPDHRQMMPAALVIGAVYLLLMDTVARTATSGEIPLGILTALIGTPVFAIILRRSARSGHAF